MCVLLFKDLARRSGSRDSVTEWKQLSFTSCTQVPLEFPDLNLLCVHCLRLALCCWTCPESLVIIIIIIIIISFFFCCREGRSNPDADKTACTWVLSRTLKGFHAGGAWPIGFWVKAGPQAQWSRVGFNCGLDAAFGLDGGLILTIRV